jgi:hypothetical protein
LINLLFPPNFIPLAANIAVAIQTRAFAASYAIFAMAAQVKTSTIISASFASDYFHNG